MLAASGAANRVLLRRRTVPTLKAWRRAIGRAMQTTKRAQIRTLLKGIETGDPESVVVVNEAKYVQHNPMTKEGSEGLAELFKRLSQTSPRVVILRMFEDGDYVFGHVEYDFAEVVTGFEVFRFEDGFAVEHWDNLQHQQSEPNASGHTMIDGATDITDLDRTESNRELVRSFADEVLVDRSLDRLGHYVSDDLIEHDPRRSDGFAVLRTALAETTSAGEPTIGYGRIHRVLAEGNFVLSAAEGTFDGVHSALYDLVRIADGQIVEHWDSIEAIPPRSEWNNVNGKF
jgi:predicted SnoaL-like aldol condensation-catalyzing enzyme